jgi:hypothetical protein
LFSIHASFGSGNVAPVSFLNNNMNKRRWTQDKHRIFMQEYMRSMAIIACKLQKFSAHKHPLKLKSMLNVSSKIIKNKFCSSQTVSRIPLSQWESSSLGQKWC